MVNKPPRIGIDYTAAVHQRAGIGRYVRGLVAALAERQPRVEGRLFVAGGRGPELSPPPAGFELRPSRLSERTHARLWYRLRAPVPVEWWTGPLDLFHATDFALPPTRPGTRTVLTVHDLAFERYPAETMPGMLGYLRRVVPHSVRRAGHAITDSEATRRDVIELYHAAPEKVSVVYPGVSARFGEPQRPERLAEVRRRYGLPDAPLVLTVGTMQPRKNHARLVEAFAQVASQTDAVLVVAGGKGWQYEAVHERVRQLGLEERVLFPGFVDDADLPALYAAATVFAYPALYEGFGLPVLEAMAAGTPVVTSAVSSLPEITGEDAALLVDPGSVDQIAGALARLLGDGDLRAHLARRGAARAAIFTWAATAEQLWQVYSRLLPARAAQHTGQ